MAKVLNTSHRQKKKIQMAVNIGKDSLTSNQENANSKHSNMTFHTLPNGKNYKV